LGLSLSLLTTACFGPPPEPEIPPTPTATPEPTTGRGIGDTLNLLFWQAPTILNPHLTVGQKDWNASRITLEPLASFAENGQLVPFLAAEIPSLDNGDVAEDGRSVTWRLRQDVLWSDGQPFTADDVVFTYDFIANPDTGATTSAIYSAVTSVEAVDDFTVRVNFKDVTPAWFLPFVGVQGLIIPRHVYEPYNGTNALDSAELLPTGTGPYQAIEFKPQEVLFLGNQLVETNKLVFVPNEHFREADKPYFSRVVLRGGGIPLEAARSVLEVGDVDFALNLQLEAETLAQLELGGQGVLLAPFGSFVERILLNRADPNQITSDGERANINFPHPILSELPVRQALALAIDRETIADLYGPAGRPARNVLVSPANYDSPNTTYEFNLEKAAALLDEAGWLDTNGDGIRDKDGTALKLLFQTSENAVRQDTQRIVQASLRDIGIEVELKIIPASVFFSNTPSNPDTRFHFYADLEEFQTGNRSPDPEAYMKNWTCDEISQKSNNWTGANIERWCSPEYDALYRQATVELDPQKREQLFIQMNDMLIEDVVIIPLVHRAGVSGVSKTITDIELTPWDADTWNIKDWKRIREE
ncbi:MAG: peptide ABC transporter substrate-binding protein, partial [Anaerolineae bacterium]|nr:peptide ABC transporter substrate-binding protein [Anaerolineae bacterium]